MTRLKKNAKYKCLTPGCTCDVRVIRVFYTGSDYIKAVCALVTKSSGVLVENIRTYKIPISAIEYWEEI